MTSPQQPQPQPGRGPDDTGAREQPLPAAPPMPPPAPQPPQGRPPQAPPAAPAQPGQQPPQQPGQQSPPAGEAGTMMLQPQQPPAREPGTMTLQAQQPPGQQTPGQPAPPAQAREAGTMMLQPQQPPAPQPLAAHGPGRDAGTMMLQPQAQPPAQDRPQHHPQAQQPPVPQQAHPQQAWAGAGGYVSPLPVRPTHLGHALASEWTKIRSLRSTIWTLGVMVALTVGIGLLATLAAGSEREMDPLLGVGFVGVLLGSLCVITLGVLSISSEYGTGMIRTTLTACPSRVRVLTAKALVFFTLALVLTTVATTLVALLDTGMLRGPAPTTDQWLRATLGAGLYVALLGLLALAVGTLLRHSAGAISTMMGVVLLPMLLALFLQGESVKDLQRVLIEYSVPSALATLYDIPFLTTGPSGWTPLLILAGVTAVVLGGAYAAVAQRDV